MKRLGIFGVVWTTLLATASPIGSAQAQVRATPLETTSSLRTSFGTLKLSPPMLTVKANAREAALQSSQFQSYFADIGTVARSKQWGTGCTRRYVLARQQLAPAQLPAAADAYHRSLTALLRPVFGSQWMDFRNELGAQKQMLSVWQTTGGLKFANLLTYTAGTKTLMIAACELG